jgi:hypothetical protein
VSSLIEAVILTATSSSSQYTPTYPGGILLAWLICNGAKRSPIGGWLLFFYWQLYGGLLMSALFFSMNIQSYIPENFDSTRKFLLFLATTVPDLVLYLIMVAVGTTLLAVRTWDLLNLLRWVILASLVVKIAGVAVDAVYFPDTNELEFLTYISIIANSLWLGYLFRSVRVKHVFQSHDWEIAVNSIYPLKPKTST